MSETERIVANFRAEVQRVGPGTEGIIIRALLDLADQRDELVAACEAARALLPSGEWWQGNEYEVAQMLDAALKKTRPADGE